MGRSLILACAVLSAAGCTARPTVIVFSRTTSFRHESIPAATATVKDIAEDLGCDVIVTEDPEVFVDQRWTIAAFINTTGDVLNDDQQVVFQRVIENGGGYFGAPAAADTEFDWPWYGEELVGAWFVRHPRIQEATISVVDTSHPATAALTSTWKRTDEWYDYDRIPDAQVLLELDVHSYEGSLMKDRHPIAWCRQVGAGRSFYTGGGHTIAAWSEPAFRAHVRGALQWLLNEDKMNANGDS